MTCLNLWYEQSANSLKDFSVLFMSKWLKSLKNCVRTRVLLMSPYKGCFRYYYWRFSNNGQDRFHLFFIVISDHSWHSVSLDFILESLSYLIAQIVSTILIILHPLFFSHTYMRSIYTKNKSNFEDWKFYLPWRPITAYCKKY